MRKTRQILGLTAAALFGTVARANAQLIDFHGSVAGCFTWTASIANGVQTTCVEPTNGNPIPGGGGPGFTSTISDGVNVGTLTYSDDSFWGTALGIGDGNAAGINNPASNGSFGVLSVTGTFDASKFTNLSLVLKFYFDADINPSTPVIGDQHTPTAGGPFLAATLTGKIVAGTGGNTTYTFDTPGAFSFINGGHSSHCHQADLNPLNNPDNACVLGSLYGTAHIDGSTNSVNGSSDTPSQAITGKITVDSIAPEPASIALFATGLVGMVPVIRYRRRKQA